MVFPVRDTPDPVADHYGETSTEAEDLRRLEATLEWLNRERMILALETAAHKPKRKLPRATPMPAVTGLSTDSESPRAAPEPLPFTLAPPLASERLQEPLPRPRYSSGMPLFVLIAVAIAGTIAYFVTVQGTFSMPEIAQAASLHIR
jgi:hypothetical protein